MIPQPLVTDDLAEPILSADPSLNVDAREHLWNVFHQSRNPEELATALQGMDAPSDTKQKLVSAKQQSVPGLNHPVDRTMDAINRITQIEPRALEAAEQHPAVLKALLHAAEQEPAKPEEQPGAEAGMHLQQPPRPDGLEHFPPVQNGHVRVLASDGGVHDLPAENLEQARQLDPRLHVLNP